MAVDFDVCQQAFGFSPEQVTYQIQHAKAIYGGNKIQGSRIMFTNGQIDPWRANGVAVSPNEEEPVLLVAGASHHFWTHPSLPTDSAPVNAARQAIWTQVSNWLAL